MIRHEGKRKDYVKRCILQRRCAKIVRGMPDQVIKS